MPNSRCRYIDFLPVPKVRRFFSLSGSDERNRTTLKMRSKAYSSGGSHNPNYGDFQESQILLIHAPIPSTTQATDIRIPQDSQYVGGLSFTN